MSNYGYGGGRQNPYDQRDQSAPGAAPYPTGGDYDPYGAPPQQQPYRQQQQPYGNQNQYGSQAMGGRDEYTGQNVELEPLAPNGQQFGRQTDPNAILNDCRDLDRGIDAIDDTLETLRSLQQRVLSDANSSGSSPLKEQLDNTTAEVMTMYRNFVARLKSIKSRPESGSPKNAPQVGRIDRKLRDAMKKYQVVDRDYRKALQDQMARQYRIVRPEASEAEVREAVEDTSDQQVFSQALLNSNRQGQSRSALSAVQSRHEELQKIERQMIELGELFQDMDNLVVQQEAAVTNIEMKGEEVVENMDKGTAQIGVAVQSAKNARKWKWWCLGISVLIIVIIVIIVLLYQFVFGPNAKSNRDSTKSKRFVLPESLTIETLVAPAQPFDASADATLSVPGLEWTERHGLVRRAQRFEA